VLNTLVAAASPPVASALTRALEGREVTVDEAVTLSAASGRDLTALLATADELRRQQVGDAVTYVVNRNINFTNVCVKTCHFCAFSRELRSEQGYLLPVEEITRRAVQARDLGATEVCLQAGLLPTARGELYGEVLAAVKQAAPELHLHALSPEEVKYGAQRAKKPVAEFLAEMKAAGLGSLPGTSAEILDDRIRNRISPGRITTEQWIEVITSAHALGIPTTSTMMFGHVETALDRARHLELLRSIQKDTGGFTEFVPLSFVHAESPLFVKRHLDGQSEVAAGPTGNDIVRLYAIARLMLGATFTNIQASWVKEGLRLAQRLLDCGVNDLGGTLINESISTAAGALNGQLVRPSTLRRVIRDAGREPMQRTTTYGRVPAELTAEARLDAVDDAAAAEMFGSYDGLVDDERFRYTFDAKSVQRPNTAPSSPR